MTNIERLRRIAGNLPGRPGPVL